MSRAQHQHCVESCGSSKRPHPSIDHSDNIRIHNRITQLAFALYPAAQIIDTPFVEGAFVTDARVQWKELGIVGVCTTVGRVRQHDCNPCNEVIWQADAMVIPVNYEGHSCRNSRQLPYITLQPPWKPYTRSLTGRNAQHRTTQPSLQVRPKVLSLAECALSSLHRKRSASRHARYVCSMRRPVKLNKFLLPIRSTTPVPSFCFNL